MEKGYLQKKGIDFHETYSPSTRAETIRIVMLHTVCESWERRKMNIMTAFLNSLLKEEVYLKQPEGFVDPDYPDWVWHVWTSLWTKSSTSWVEHYVNSKAYLRWSGTVQALFGSVHQEGKWGGYGCVVGSCQRPVRHRSSILCRHPKLQTWLDLWNFQAWPIGHLSVFEGREEIKRHSLYQLIILH